MTDFPPEPVMTAPPPGSTLRGAVEIFAWDLGGIAVESSWLFVGDQEGGSQYASKSVGGRTSTSVGNLAGSSQTFRWAVTSLPVESWRIHAGSTVGGSDHAARFTAAERQATVDGLPTDGSTVHVRLYFQVESWWYFIDDSYEAATVVAPDRDELTRELQRLVGVDDDGIVGPITIAALNENWLGRTAVFDASFAERFTNDPDVVKWVQRRINTRAEAGLVVDGAYGPTTEAAVIDHLDKGGVVAAESFIALLDAA